MKNYCIDPQGITKKHREHLWKYAIEAGNWDTAKRNEWEYRGLEFPEHPLYIQSSVLRDLNCAYQSIFATLQLVAQCVLSGNLCINHEQIIDLLALPHYVAYTIKKHYTQIPPHLFWGRPDFIFSNNGPLCLETNFSAVSGFQLQVSSLVHYYNQHPISQRIMSPSSWMADPLSSLTCIAKSIMTNCSPLLLADVHEPRRHDSRTRTSYEGMTLILNEKYNFPAITGFINDLVYAGDVVYLNDTIINYVFMSIYNPDEYQFFNDFTPLLENIEKGNVLALDSVMEILWSSKILFAAISEHIDLMPIPISAKKDWRHYTPWTRIVRDKITDYLGQKVSLPTLLKQNQDGFVLKFAGVSEGKGVYIGKTVSSEKWNELLESALSSSPSRWIVQEYIKTQPSMTTSKSDNLELYDNESEWVASPYFCMNHYAGMLVRFYSNKERQEDKPIGCPNNFGTVAIYS